MTAWRRCAYCGYLGAKIRLPGEPATCYCCRDVPKREREVERELEAELERYYDGAEPPRS